MVEKIQSKSLKTFSIMLSLALIFVLPCSNAFAQAVEPQPTADKPADPPMSMEPQVQPQPRPQAEPQPSSPIPRPPPAEQPETREPWEQSLIDENIKISEWFDGVAEGVDLFLAGKKFTKKRNDSRVTVETSVFYREIDGLSDATSFNVNLRLPNVEEYWQLTFTSYDETKERGITRSYLRQTGRERDYGATIGFFKKLGNVRTAFQPRIGFAGTPKISHALSFESIAEQPRGYRINPKLEFYANADRGTGIFQSFNLNFQLTPIYSFTLVNEGDYEDRTHNYGVTHGFALGQWLSSKTSLNYGVYFNFSNYPNYQLAEYILSVSWNHLLYKNILDYEFIPYLNFNRDRDFGGYYGAILNVRLNF